MASDLSFDFRDGLALLGGVVAGVAGHLDGDVADGHQVVAALAGRAHHCDLHREVGFVAVGKNMVVIDMIIDENFSYLEGAG